MEPIAAVLHAPILLKSRARGRLPILWDGCLSVPLAKPGKPLTSPDSYRAIALQQPASKALHKACRPQLCSQFETVTMQGVGGARPQVALSLPAILSLAQAQGRYLVSFSWAVWQPSTPPHARPCFHMTAGSW